MSRANVSVILLFLAALSVSAQTCTPFKNINHRMIVKVIINGKGPYAFLLDTGSQSTLIDSNLMEANDLKKAGTVDVAGMGLHEQTDWTVLDQFEFAGKTASKLRVIIYDLTKTQGPGDARIFGIIGEDYLENYAVKIDKRNSCVELSD